MGGGGGGPECVVTIVILLLMSWQSLLAKFSLYHFRALRLSHQFYFPLFDPSKTGGGRGHSLSLYLSPHAHSFSLFPIR